MAELIDYNCHEVFVVVVVVVFVLICFFYFFFKLILAQNYFHDCIQNQHINGKKKNNHSLKIKSKLMNKVLCQSKQSFTHCLNSI